MLIPLLEALRLPVIVEEQWQRNPAKYVYAEIFYTIKIYCEKKVHKRTHGASTIASSLTMTIEISQVSRSQESSVGKRLSYVKRTSQYPVSILL